MLDPLTCMEMAGHPVQGVLHVGVRGDRPLPDYRNCGASPCIYVEREQAIYEQLAEQFASDPWHHVLLARCSDEINEITFSQHEPSEELFVNGQKSYSKITIDQIVSTYSSSQVPNLIVLNDLDFEENTLAGAAETLVKVDGIFVRVSEGNQYPDGSTFIQLQMHLLRFGLQARGLELNAQGTGYAFFARPVASVESLPAYGGNLAKGKQAAQSSLSVWSKEINSDEAAGAISGSISGECSFHTDLEDGPWWFVDIGEVHLLQEIRVFNRLGPAKMRARTLKALISTDGYNWSKVHDQAGYAFGGADGRPLRIMLRSRRARYVALRLSERTWLHLDEVEVY